MQNHELLSKLINLNVDTVDGFEEEYYKIVNPNPNRDLINKKVFELISFVCSNRNPAIFRKHPKIEKLTGSRGLYAIRITTGCNIRILFSIGKQDTILLHSFEEIGGKSATDYSHAIPIAEKRLATFKGGKR